MSEDERGIFNILLGRTSGSGTERVKSGYLDSLLYIYARLTNILGRKIVLFDHSILYTAHINVRFHESNKGKNIH